MSEMNDMNSTIAQKNADKTNEFVHKLFKPI